MMNWRNLVFNPARASCDVSAGVLCLSKIAFNPGREEGLGSWAGAGAPVDLQCCLRW
jgi:hypothetical protein